MTEWLPLGCPCAWLDGGVRALLDWSVRCDAPAQIWVTSIIGLFFLLLSTFYNPFVELKMNVLNFVSQLATLLHAHELMRRVAKGGWDHRMRVFGAASAQW